MNDTGEGVKAFSVVQFKISNFKLKNTRNVLAYKKNASQCKLESKVA